MEEDAMKRSKKEDLQKWIRKKVNQMGLLSPEVLQKHDELQSLLQKRQKMDASLLKLQESVAACEAIVRKLYSLLGWEYRDTDCDGDEGTSGDGGHVAPTPCESVQSRTQVHVSPAVTGHNPLLPKKQGSENPHKRRKLFQMKEPVVVLTRLPEWQIRDLLRPRPPMFSSEGESLGLWEPEKESSDLESESVESSRKRRKTDEAKKHVKHVSPAALRVNMTVLAKKSPMVWQRGKITEIETKEGRVKCKVHFEEKGKSVVSAHHIASAQVASVNKLFVGARVVIKSKADRKVYHPGVLAELPSRKNSERFLVFIDDHTPVYVFSTVIHLVVQPLPNPLDDISDENHKSFMEFYLKSWPHPMMTYHPKGEIIEVEHNGVQKKCEVMRVDGSLLLVVFQEDQLEEWIYRGSTRLKHMMSMRQHLEKRKSKQSTTPNL